MKALPLWQQPSASLVAVGAKRIETRSWRAPAGLIGQRIAIHATKRTDRQPGGWNAGAPSALIAYGQQCAEAIAAARLGMTFAVHARELDGQASLWERAA